ncbi:MAG TPA: AAA family ATPase, partial [Acholeplasmataceae bacterium]|nr:AAA family ATPase [Acholeplasmataceae bacterium]
VDFKNTIIIMTSNLGSEYLLNGESESKVIDLVKRTFKPEFINRLDEIIVFNPLSKEVQIKITEKLLTDLTNKLKSRDILVSFDYSVRDQVIKDAYSEEYGARPLIRYIEKHIETLIAKLIIKDEIKPNHEYVMIYEGEYRLKD